MAESYTDTIKRQEALLLDELSKRLTNTTSYALVDFPDHSNVGDSAIWLGEIELFKKVTGNLPSYVCSISNFSPIGLRNACPSGPIIIHGGGNFGDIWKEHQVFREMILREFKDRAIIQMPQSIKFREPAGAEECAAAISEHPDFVLFVRDIPSQSFAANSFDCHVILAPDAALGLGAIGRPTEPKCDVLLLLRTDRERIGYDATPFRQIRNSIQEDWLDEPSYLSRRLSLKNSIRGLLNGSASGGADRARLYNQLAKHRVQRGLKLLSKGKSVITDRLHAHILSFLMGIPHVALDNDYGKVSGYIEAWNHDSGLVKTATSASDAIRKLGTIDA